MSVMSVTNEDFNNVLESFPLRKTVALSNSYMLYVFVNFAIFINAYLNSIGKKQSLLCRF